jgi:hypothetical protein
VVVAVLAATTAYWIMFRLIPWRPYMRGLRRLCAAIMGLAVSQSVCQCRVAVP